MATLGDIVTTLSVDRRNFSSGLSAAQKEANAAFGRITLDARRAGMAMGGSDGFAGGGGKATFVMLELARGAEDAASQFGTRGLAGAITASANNLSMMATIINPLAGVVVGIGAALAMVLIPRLQETGKAAETAAEKLQRLKGVQAGTRATGRTRILADEVDELLAQRRGLRERVQDRDALNRRMTGTESDRRGVVKEISGRLGGRRTAAGDIDAVIDDLRSRALAAREQGGADQLTNVRPAWGRSVPKRAGNVRRAEQLEKSLADAMARRAAITKQIADDEQQLGTAQRLLKERVDSRLAAMRAGTGGGNWLLEERNREMAAADARLDPNFGDSDRLRATEEFQIARSVLGSLQGRQLMLEQQRTFLQNDRPMQLPGAHVAGQSATKILELVQNRKNIESERIQKQQLKVNEKQLAELKRLSDTIRDKFPDLKPSRA